jgi:CheY-like chemotaxis protein
LVAAADVGTSGSPKRTVLVVDDARVMRMLLKTWLERLGFVVVEATSSVEALALLARSRFDLVMCDVNMPGPSGFSVLDHLKRDANRPPFVFLTTLGRDGDIARGLALGADAYLTKPLSWARLRATIDEVAKRTAR